MDISSIEREQMVKWIQDGYKFSEVMRSTPDLMDIAEARDKGVMGDQKLHDKYTWIRDRAMKIREEYPVRTVEDALRSAKHEWLSNNKG